MTGFTAYRLSNILYGDPTFTGRSVIWEFVKTEIDHRPLLGWGYQSFWLAGPDAPSILNAPGWVKTMPNAHSGYFDTLVELGYVGYALLLAFIIATLHAIGRVADRAPLRAWLLLSLAIHIIITNGLETLWMRGFEMLWVVFLIVAAETARYWTSSAPARAGRRSRSGYPAPGILSRSQRASGCIPSMPPGSPAQRSRRPRPNRRSPTEPRRRPRARLPGDFDCETDR